MRNQDKITTKARDDKFVLKYFLERTQGSGTDPRAIGSAILLSRGKSDKCPGTGFVAIPVFHNKRRPSMCDYSLHNVATRPAQIEDKLVTTNFSNSMTRDFSAVGQPNVAVCLLPGTEIAFDENVKCDRLGGILPSKKIGQRLARFRQINMKDRASHHDALEFPDGQVVLLTRLCTGQPATVLQLPISAHPAGAEEGVEPEVREPALTP
jgi:hypothetical protein